MKSRYLLRVICLLALLASFVPAGNASALVSTAVPPADMFQLPWEQGLAWVAIDGLDNGIKRPLSSSHNFTVGGAIDFAPHNNMVKGENTSTFWTTAAAAGTVVGTSACHVIIDHGNGWITQYQFLANVQVRLGDAVSRNQRLGIIADGVRQKFCPGSTEPNVPHLHFMLRPTMRNATFAGWQVNYLPILNKTTFTKNGETLGLFKPLLNVMDSPSTPTPTTTATSEPTNTPTPATATLTPTALTATPTTPSGPFVLTEVNPTSINIDENALVTVSLNNVPPNEYTSAEFTCTYDESLVEASSISVASLFGADPVTAINGPQSGSFIVAIAGSNNNKATTSGAVFTFDVEGLQAGQTALDCAARVSKGDNVLTDLPAIGTGLSVLGSVPTATSTPTPFDTPTSITPVESSTSTPVESSTPVEPPPIFTATPTPPVNDWLTFTNSIYGFEFKYPPQGVIADGRTDNFARIDLPFVEGTNLHEKYLEMIVQQDVNPCRSPEQSPDPGETITINGIPFLKQTWTEAAAGNHYQLTVYSTSRDNVCVSLSLVLHSLNPDNSTPTEVPFDYAAEIAVVDQIVGTYMWLASMPTATSTLASTPVTSQTPTDTLTPFATFTPTPAESLTPTFTSTSIVTSTSTPISGAVLTGEVIAVKIVTVRLYDPDENFVAAVNANPDGTFRFEVAAGTYTIVATANGFLRIQGSITLAEGDVRAMPVITLLAGDIDDNNEIDQFDAMTIGFNYNTTFPEGADLNNDGIINILDLELLAKNYRKTGPVVWE